AERARVDALVELGRREPVADLAAERPATLPGVDHALDGDAVDPHAHRGERERQAIHDEAWVDTGADDGDAGAARGAGERGRRRARDVDPDRPEANDGDPHPLSLVKSNSAAPTAATARRSPSSMAPSRAASAATSRSIRSSSSRAPAVAAPAVSRRSAAISSR